MNEKRIKQIFVKLREGHRFWVKGDVDYRDRLEKTFNPLFDELEELGVARHFAQSLLFFGKEFVDSLRDEEGGVVATLEDVERIFKSKAVDMTEREQKAFKLALRANALIYKTILTRSKKVAIEVLEYNTNGPVLQGKLI